MDQALMLQEEVLLLALKDEKGTIDWRAEHIDYLLAGAVFAELLLADRIVLSKDKKQTVRVVDSQPLDDIAVDAFLSAMQKSTKTRPVQHWLQKLATGKTREQVAQSLCRKGILKEEEHKILGLFKSNRYPERDPRAEAAVIERLRRAVKGIDREVDVRTTVLISMLHQADLLSLALPKSDIKNNKERIEKITRGELVGQATAKVIEAVQTTVVMMAVMPIFLSTTIISS